MRPSLRLGARSAHLCGAHRPPLWARRVPVWRAPPNTLAQRLAILAKNVIRLLKKAFFGYADAGSLWA